MKMSKYILNSAVLTAFGEYVYKQLPLFDATFWLQTCDWESTIGYPETAEALSKISQIQIPVNRKVITMQPGDEALVFRLVFPQGYRPDPSQKGVMGQDFVLKNCEIGLLKRIK
jgi:hypothetical protein